MNCGLLGRKLSHSYSPAIHALLADYSYALFEKEPEELETFLRTGDFQGLNVTIPYKKAVIPHCAALSPLAEELGSVNTLVRRPDGTLYGDNTDAWGFEAMLHRILPDCRGKKALVLGSGGASATAQAILRREGARPVVISRSGPVTYADLIHHGDAQILVNATPVGMYPENGTCLVDLDLLPRLEAVLDLVYNPVRTRLILEAQARNIPCDSGLYMLVGQAVRACELWTGREIPAETLETVWKTVGSSMENLILIGMPGSGKSTVGRLLAQALGRPFVDADAELVKRIGDIPAFFAAHGEDAFRRAETAVLAELGKLSGHVIATGGGCVTRPENYDLLHQNGRLIRLQRDPEQLPAEGRPVTQRDGIAALYAQRKPLYAQFTDLAADNNGSLNETVENLINMLS